MDYAIALVALVAAVVVVAGLCRRLDLPTPLVLVAVGFAVSYLPFVPEVELGAEVVLVGLLPPLLYSAALQSSLVEFNTNRVPILMLSIGLVAFTAVGVGLVMHTVVPGLGWPAAFALGAVVGPPDAVSSSAIGRRIGLPRRVVTILEGESLLNDATALVALRTAVAAATMSVSVGSITLGFVVAAGAGVLVGVAAYLLVGRVRRLVTEPVLDTSISFLTPFLAYVAAEEVQGSGVLAVVVSGLLLAHRAPVLQTARSRIAERLNWRTISFLLENAVFLLIGLQARRVITDVADGGLSAGVVVGACAAALGAVMVLRLVWVLSSGALLVRHPERRVGESRFRDSVVVGWAGMRGVVTLAAAFAIPADFDQRELLVLVAFVVTGGTLFVQGLSLPWLARALRVPSPDPREDALARAGLFQEASAAGLAALRAHEGEEDPYDSRGAVRRRVELRDFAAWERLGAEPGPGAEPADTPSEAYARLRLEALQAERERVLQVRDTGHVPADVVAEVLYALDLEESGLDFSYRERRSRSRHPGPVQSGTGPPLPPCEHLVRAPDPPGAAEHEPVCAQCLREGTTWVHLRRCLACGTVGCCDSSPGRHASAHYHATTHPVVVSAEHGESWRWCFVDERLG